MATQFDRGAVYGFFRVAALSWLLLLGGLLLLSVYAFATRTNVSIGHLYSIGFRSTSGGDSGWVTGSAALLPATLLPAMVMAALYELARRLRG